MRALSFLCLASLSMLGTGRRVSAQASGTTPRGHAVMPMGQGGVVSAVLTGIMGSRKASGVATITGQTIHIAWTGDEPGSRRAWSIRRGSCVRDEGVARVVSTYPAMIVDAAGGATGTAALEAPLTTERAMYVEVHDAAMESTDGPPESLACGALGNGTSMPYVATASTATAGGSMPAMDHATMDHSRMAMPGLTKPGVTTAGATMPEATMPSMLMSSAGDSTAAALMAIHQRMMADPVIRERVMSDPALQRMMDDVATQNRSAGMPMPSTTSAPSASTRTGKSASKVTTKAARKAAAKPPVRPASTPTPKAEPRPTLGMDHSKMPGMDMSKTPSTNKPATPTPAKRKPPV